MLMKPVYQQWSEFPSFLVLLCSPVVLAGFSHFSEELRGIGLILPVHILALPPSGFVTLVTVASRSLFYFTIFLLAVVYWFIRQLV